MPDILKANGTFELYGRVYGFLKRWANDPPTTNSAWGQVVAEADQICHDYRGQPLEALACSLTGSAVAEIERLTRIQ